MSDLHAAIDIGTNSFHLVVARADSDGGFDVLTTEKEMVRMGRGGGEMKELADDAIDRGLATLDRMVQVARSFGAVDLSVVATSAVREASNQAIFLDRAREELAVEVEVISGFEEARLIHLGVLQALPVYDKRALLVDIGGGSTEFVISEGERVVESRSMKLGAVRMTERFFVGADDIESATTNCRQYIRAALAPVSRELRGHQPEVSIGSSGTIATIASMAAHRRGESARQTNGASFSASELASIVEVLAGIPLDAPRKMSGLDAKRADIITAGSILLQEIFLAFEIDEMTVSEFALREGVLLDRFGGSRSAGISRLADLRRTNLLRLARQLDPDPDHALQTAKLATQLFDRTVEIHGLGAAERELLDGAAIVHNVGLFISHSSHHKHSYYVIRNSEHLTGFAEHEVEMIAVVARYHRKSHPTNKHQEFARLRESDQQVVRVLAGLLRVAIGLDRAHSGVVEAVRVFVEGGQLVIQPIAAPGADVDLEVWAARERSRLLAGALELDVVVESASREGSEFESS